MTAEKIIFNKLYLVWANKSNVSITDLERLSRIAVAEIREQFKARGIDPWKEVNNEDPEETLHDQSKHPEG